MNVLSGVATDEWPEFWLKMLPQDGIIWNGKGVGG